MASRLARLHCVQASDVEHTTCTSVINEQDTTDVLTQTEDLPLDYLFQQ